MSTRIVYAAAPTVHLREGPGSGKKVQQLLWGDRVKLADDAECSGDWVKVKSRHVEGWVRTTEIQEEALREVTFVDVGQGDGCLMVMPDDRHYVIDAGKGRDMVDFCPSLACSTFARGSMSRQLA